MEITLPRNFARACRLQLGFEFCLRRVILLVTQCQGSDLRWKDADGPAIQVLKQSLLIVGTFGSLDVSLHSKYFDVFRTNEGTSMLSQKVIRLTLAEADDIDHSNYDGE